MHRHRRLSVFVFIVAAAVLTGSLPAGAEAARNDVLVVNQTDTRTASQARAAVVNDQSPTVDDENAAVARASCTDCRTVAVAVQIVTVDGTASDVSPLNAAVALNEDCLRCQTYAYARQEIITIDGDFTLSQAGRVAVDRLEDEIERTAATDEPFLELGASLDDLVLELREVVRADLGRAGRRETGRIVRRAVDVRPS